MFPLLRIFGVDLVNAIGTTMFVQLIAIIVMTIVFRKLITMAMHWRNKKIERQNQAIRARNAEIINGQTALRQQEEYAVNEFNRIKAELNSMIQGWYPQAYLDSESAKFFLHLVENYRANTMQEAVNLWEEEKYRRKIEDAQREMIEEQRRMVKQQQLTNMLAAANLAVGLANLDAINSNTAAIHAEGKALRNIIRPPRYW